MGDNRGRLAPNGDQLELSHPLLNFAIRLLSLGAPRNRITTMRPGITVVGPRGYAGRLPDGYHHRSIMMRRYAPFNLRYKLKCPDLLEKLFEKEATCGNALKWNIHQQKEVAARRSEFSVLQATSFERIDQDAISNSLSASPMTRQPAPVLVSTSVIRFLNSWPIFLQYQVKRPLLLIIDFTIAPISGAL